MVVAAGNVWNNATVYVLFVGQRNLSRLPRRISALHNAHGAPVPFAHRHESMFLFLVKKHIVATLPRLSPEKLCYIMQLLSQILIMLVAVEHLYILWLEMFAWETRGKKVFRGAMKDELFAPTKVMAANQGLYNGFLAAGLIWSLLIADAAWSRHVAVFFLSCVVVAGTFGAATAGRKIFFVQALPALVALAILLFFR